MTNKRGSVFSLLLGNYILFTLFLVLILAALFAILLLRMIGMMINVNPSQTKNYDNLLSEQNYEEFPIERLLGTDGSIVVLNSQLQVVFKSGKAYPIPQLSFDDVACIPEFSVSPEVVINSFTTVQGDSHTSISIQETLEGSENYRNYILDQNNHILYQSGDLPMDTLTAQQVKLLSDSYSPKYSLQKYSFQTQAGETQTMLLFGNRTEKQTAIERSLANLFITFILIYSTMVLLFILWLNRKIKKPLNLLCEELNRFDSGKEQRASYTGPKEFVNIFESFNEMSQRLKHSEEERLRLEEAKQKMLADISHDLKTPITVVQGYAKALCDGVVPISEQPKYLRTIEQKSTKLNELINSFHEYSKMEHPDYNLELVSKDICNYLRDYVAERYADLELAGFAIEVEIPEEHILCNIDTVQLSRAFDNILNNTLKHNPKGTTLYVSLIQIDEQTQILMGDNGVGIPPEIRNIIFTPFVVGEASRSNHGSGLGLSITKKIIEAHNGTIELIEPKPPYSTIYKIYLPIA